MTKAEETWRAEIAALRAEIDAIKAKKEPLGEAAAEAANKATESARKGLSDMIAQATETIDELHNRFNETTHNAEETVSQHPLATLASAFLLGLVIGRITR